MKKVMKFVKGKKDEDSKQVIYVDPQSINFDKDADDENNQEIMDENKQNVELDDDNSILTDKSITKVHRAVWTENIDSLLNIIKTNDVDITDKLDRTALYFAVMRNNPAIVELLLEHGANQNIPDIDGVTPFLKSVQMGSLECVLTLLKHNADYKRVDKDSNSCLHYAVSGGHVEILSLLLNQNIDCNIHNVCGEVALHVAAGGAGEQRMCELLIGRGAGPDARDSRQATPLMRAAQQGHAHIVSLLLATNAHPHLVDSQGRTAADYAEASGFKEIASQLRNYSRPSHSGTTGHGSDNRDNDDSDTWNDSPVSTPSLNNKKIDKQLTRIAQQFLREESDISGNDDHSESSKSSAQSSIRKSETSSPQSGVIPPPCKPLRSLEYLQSGRPDQSHQSQSHTSQSGPQTPGPQPHHVMTLASVRSRHISMTEHVGENKKYETLPNRYSYQGEIHKSDTHKCSQNTAAPDLVAYCSLGAESKVIPAPLPPTTAQTSPPDTSPTTPIPPSNRQPSDTTFLQKQFSIIENYERNHSRTCSVSHDRHSKEYIDDNNHIRCHIDENNQIIKLEKYVVVEKSVMSKKSRSLPRNYESNNGYNQGSNSLPRTLDCGKDFVRDMKRYGSYRPKSHHLFPIKSKSEGGSKKHGFIDKLKNMFGKKAQIHLTDCHDPNNTWLYKEKTCSRNSYNTEKMRCNYDDVSLSSDSVKGYERKGLPLASMSLELGHSRKSSCSRSFSEKNTHDHKTDDEAKSGKSTPKLDVQFSVFCEECSEYMNLKLQEMKLCIENKEKLIELLQEQLETLTARNLASVKEKQDILFKLNIIKQENDNLKEISKKYEDDLKRLVYEKSNRRDCQCSVSVITEADKWHKHHEMDLEDPLEQENKRLEDLITNLQSDLSSSNRRLCEMECMLNRAQTEVDQIVANETIKLKQTIEQENKTTIQKLKEDNTKLRKELNSIRCGYDKLHNIYSETERAFSESVDEHGCIIDENQELKVENKNLSQKLLQLSSQINLIKDAASKTNKTLRVQLKKSSASLVKAGDGPNRKSSIDFNELTLPITEEIISECACQLEENSLQSISDLVVQIQTINSENAELYFKLHQSELQKALALMENENDRLKEKLEQQNTTIDELKKTITEIKEENLEGCNKIEDLIEDNEKLRRGMEEMLPKMEYLKDDIINKNQIIKEQDTKIIKFLSDTQKTEQVIRDLEEKLRIVQSDYDKKCCYALASDTQKMELQNKLINLEDKFKIVETENVDLKQKVDKLNNEKVDNAKQLKNAKDSIVQLQNNFVACKNSIDNLQISNAQLQDAAKEVSDKYGTLEKTYEDNISSFKKKIEILDSENNGLKERIQEGQNKCETLENKIAVLTLQYDNELLNKNLQCTRFKRNECKMCQELCELKLKSERQRQVLEEKLTEKNMMYQELFEEFYNRNEQLNDTNDNYNIINQENLEMKSAVEILKSILNENIGEIFTKPETTVKLEKIASEIIERLGKREKVSKSSSVNSIIPKNISVQKLPGKNIKKQMQKQLTSQSLPDLNKFKTKELFEIKKFDSEIRKTLSVESLLNKDNCDRQLEAIHKLRYDLERVKNKLFEFKTKRSLSVPSAEILRDDYYREIIGNLKGKVNELQEKATRESYKTYDLETELRDLKGNVAIMSDMEKEICSLRQELQRERTRRMQEIEIVKIKKEQELRDMKENLKEEFLTRKQKLLTDLTYAQTALHDKNMEEIKLKEKCEKLSQDVKINQESRKKRIENSYQEVSSFSGGSYGLSSPYSVACIAVTPSVSSALVRTSQSLKDVYSAELDTAVHRHRIQSDPNSVGHLPENEDLKKKYLIK